MGNRNGRILNPQLLRPFGKGALQVDERRSPFRPGHIGILPGGAKNADAQCLPCRLPGAPEGCIGLGPLLSLLLAVGDFLCRENLLRPGGELLQDPFPSFNLHQIYAYIHMILLSRKSPPSAEARLPSGFSFLLYRRTCPYSNKNMESFLAMEKKI